MSTLQCDVIVVGAGVVGICSALHLQSRNRSVVLVDRRAPAEETSYGNAGVIQLESIVRYAFPRSPTKILKYALNVRPEARLHWPSLPWIINPLVKYWACGKPEYVARCARAMWMLTKDAITEHDSLMRQAGIHEQIRRTGYLKLFRHSQLLEETLRTDEEVREILDLDVSVLDISEVRRLEPHVDEEFAGGLFFPQSASVSDPGGVAKSYAKLFESRDGQFCICDASRLEQSSGGWRLSNSQLRIQGRDLVIAMGPWSDDVLRQFGLRVPLAVKRGYHMHFRPEKGTTFLRPIVDADYGYVVSEMRTGVRLTTGAEFATRDARPTPVQLSRVEPVARQAFHLEDRIDDQPWCGARPFLPDLLPVIGDVPGFRGLWVNFGHHHLGLTTGPSSGRLLAEMMTRRRTSIDPRPYRIARFM